LVNYKEEEDFEEDEGMVENMHANSTSFMIGKYKIGANKIFTPSDIKFVTIDIEVEDNDDEDNKNSHLNKM
jgi:hypothetical protein